MHIICCSYCAAVINSGASFCVPRRWTPHCVLAVFVLYPHAVPVCFLPGSVALSSCCVTVLVVLMDCKVGPWPIFIKISLLAFIGG